MYHQWSWFLCWQGDYNILNGVGSYVEGEITISSMGLAHTVTDAQCTTNRVGSYVGREITILPMVLVLTVPDAQCTTNGVGSYIDGWNVDNFLF